MKKPESGSHPRLCMPTLRVAAMLALSACLTLVGCQRPTQSLPAAPIFSMPPKVLLTTTAAVSEPSAESGPAPFQPFAGSKIIYFQRGSAQLDAQARMTLDRQAEWLLLHPAVTATLRGHADLFGGRARQFAIGEMRATAMRSYLVARGVSPDQLSVTSLGKQMPITTVRDEASQRRNRRGETIFSEIKQNNER